MQFICLSHRFCQQNHVEFLTSIFLGRQGEFFVLFFNHTWTSIYYIEGLSTDWKVCSLDFRFDCIPLNFFIERITWNDWILFIINLISNIFLQFFFIAVFCSSMQSMVDNLHCAVGVFVHEINLWHVLEVESDSSYHFLQSIFGFHWYNSISGRHDMSTGQGIIK